MTALSLASVLAEPARRRPDVTAVVEGPAWLTYGELWRDARGVAAALAARGTGPGDRVALLAPNVADFVRCYFGILAAGGVVVPVPTLLTGREAALKENLARHKYPRLVRVLPELPMGPSQKVLKRELRQRFAPQT